LQLKASSDSTPPCIKRERTSDERVRIRRERAGIRRERFLSLSSDVRSLLMHIKREGISEDRENRTCFIERGSKESTHHKRERMSEERVHIRRERALTPRVSVLTKKRDHILQSVSFDKKRGSIFHKVSRRNTLSLLSTCHVSEERAHIRTKKSTFHRVSLLILCAMCSLFFDMVSHLTLCAMCSVYFDMRSLF